MRERLEREHAAASRQKVKRALLDQLDARRAQVYIESLIVEVDPSQTADFGIQWQGVIGKKGDTNIVGVGTNFGTGLKRLALSVRNEWD